MISKMTCPYWQSMSMENYPFIMSFACSFRTEKPMLSKIGDPRCQSSSITITWPFLWTSMNACLQYSRIGVGYYARANLSSLALRKLSPGSCVVWSATFPGPQTDCRILEGLYTVMYPCVCQLMGTSQCWARRLHLVGKRSLELETGTPSLSPGMYPSLLCGFGSVVSCL